MKLLIAVDTRFYRTPDGIVWTEAQNNYQFWANYLRVYEDLLIVARVKDVSNKQLNWIQSSGDRVEFHGLPYYLGPWEYMKKFLLIKSSIAKAVSNSNCAILRVPGTIASLVWKELRKQRKEYMLEVCGDPWESLAPGTVKSVVRPLARWISTYELKKQCKKALGTSYVTSSVLQRRYPPHRKSVFLTESEKHLNDKYITTSYSDIELTEEAFRRKLNGPQDPIRLINVGSMETYYKAQDVQIKALKKCLDLGYSVHLFLVGSGRCRPIYEELAKELQVQNHVTFLGSLPGLERVIQALDESDIFLLPSMVEGLPRALIEAMARGLPCIATNVGGIPELLVAEDLVPPNDPEALSKKIIDVISTPERMSEMSERNFIKSTEFAPHFIHKKRYEYYSFLKKRLGITSRTKELRMGGNLNEWKSK